MESLGNEVFPVKQELHNIDPSQFDHKPVKKEPSLFYDDDFIFNPNTDTSSSYAKTPKLMEDDASQQTTIPDLSNQNSNSNYNNNNLQNDNETQTGDENLRVEHFSPLTTAKCSDVRLEQVLTVVGGLASKWGYFENEIIFLVSKRLEIFFLTVTEATILGKI